MSCLQIQYNPPINRTWSRVQGSFPFVTKKSNKPTKSHIYTSIVRGQWLMKKGYASQSATSTNFNSHNLQLINYSSLTYTVPPTSNNVCPTTTTNTTITTTTVPASSSTTTTSPTTALPPSNPPPPTAQQTTTVPPSSSSSSNSGSSSSGSSSSGSSSNSTTDGGILLNNTFQNSCSKQIIKLCVSQKQNNGTWSPMRLF